MKNLITIHNESQFTVHRSKFFKILKRVQNDKNFGSLCKVQNDMSSLFTTHNSLFTEKLSVLVSQCLRTFCNGLLRFTRNDGLFTTHHSRLTKKLIALVPQCLSAFTLAETLIVIGIIGVVAALTLPNLNHATGDKERVTKVKKIYSALTEAFDRAQAIYGDYDTWFNDFDDSISYAQKNERLAKRIIEFMKISKDCGFDSGCFTNNNAIFLKDNDTIVDRNYDTNLDYYKVITADDMSIGFTEYDIIVDIDGPNKGPLQHGKDLFYFLYSSGMIEPETGGPGSGPTRWGAAAAKWIIENDNADYLKADSTGKCNDSDIVLDGVTNTSCH